MIYIYFWHWKENEPNFYTQKYGPIYISLARFRSVWINRKKRWKGGERKWNNFQFSLQSASPFIVQCLLHLTPNLPILWCNVLWSRSYKKRDNDSDVMWWARWCVQSTKVLEIHDMKTYFTCGSRLIYLHNQLVPWLLDSLKFFPCLLFQPDVLPERK